MKKDHYKTALEIIKKHSDYDRMELEDRDVLERIIFPFVLSEFNPQKILDIGREDYQSFYNEFFKGRELWTLDIDPERKEFGSENHITDNVANLKNHFPENSFDFVLMNGVFGWGLNEKEEIEKAFNAVHSVLSERGIFILGWNNLPGLVPVPLEEVEPLKKFKPYYFKPLKGSQFKAKTGEHTYNFYTK